MGPQGVKRKAVRISEVNSEDNEALAVSTVDKIVADIAKHLENEELGAIYRLDYMMKSMENSLEEVNAPSAVSSGPTTDKRFHRRLLELLGASPLLNKHMVEFHKRSDIWLQTLGEVQHSTFLHCNTTVHSIPSI